MSSTAKLSTTLAAIALVTMTLSGCSATTAPQVAEPTPTPTVSATRTPAYLTELPEWARDPGTPWLIYPEGYECYGTEGCPNDYRAFFGQPGPVLPEDVEYYDPAIHGVIATPPAQ